MRRILTPLLLAALVLSGCGRKTEPTKPTVPPPLPTRVTQPPTTVPPSAELAETQLYQENGITVVAEGMEDGVFGPEITIAVTNETDRGVVITSRHLSVNGYMLPGSSFYCEVAAGKKARESLTLMDADLQQAGIEAPGEIAFTLHLADKDSYETIADSELLTLRTSLHGTFTQPHSEEGQILYEKDGIRVMFRGLQKDAVWDAMAVFYLENNSDRTVTVWAEDVSVNDYMADVALWTDLRPGTRAVDAMYLSDLEDISGMEAITSMELTLRITDAMNWEDIDTSAPISLDLNGN